jgi:16S rRNA processing protein RimM
MIKKDEVFKIGIFNKPHGVKGEISFTFTDDIFDRVECEYNKEFYYLQNRYWF